MKHKESSVILVFNDRNELLLQQRSFKDDKYPGHWDFSAAGGIDPGEDSHEAAKRELSEELGIEASVEFIAEELYQDNKSEDKLFIYRAKHNGPFKPDYEKEVEKVRFFSLDEIEQMLNSGEKFHPEFPFL